MPYQEEMDGKYYRVGDGAQGAVYYDRNKKKSHNWFALKDQCGHFMEKAILRLILGNSNIIKYFDFLTSSEYFFLILKYIDGKDLLTKLNKDNKEGRKPFNESNSRWVDIGHDTGAFMGAKQDYEIGALPIAVCHCSKNR